MRCEAGDVLHIPYTFSVTVTVGWRRALTHESLVGEILNYHNWNLIAEGNLFRINEREINMSKFLISIGHQPTSSFRLKTDVELCQLMTTLVPPH